MEKYQRHVLSHTLRLNMGSFFAMLSLNELLDKNMTRLTNYRTFKIQKSLGTPVFEIIDVFLASIV
jgi:hypothetical protein